MSVILWDIQAGLAAKKFQGHQKAVSALALNDLVPLPTQPTLPNASLATADKPSTSNSTNSQSSSQPSDTPASTADNAKKTPSAKRIVVKKIVVDKSDL